MDTRNLIPSQSNKDPSSMISTRGFVTGSLERWGKAMRRTRFGDPKRISVYKMGTKVRECLAIADDAKADQLRTIVLVQHAADESHTMYSLGVAREGGSEGVQVTLDIGRIAVQVLEGRSGQRIALGALSEELCTPFENSDFHSAGNDANCILRVLLLLAVRYQENRSCTESQAKLLTLLRQIAQAPLPPRKTESEVEELVALQTTNHIDDPSAPIDRSYFNVRTTRKEGWHRILQAQRKFRCLREIPWCRSRD